MTTPQPSRLSLDTRPDRLVVVDGTIDSHTAGLLADAIDELGAVADVKLDLGQVDFIDSSGLRTLIMFHQDLESHGQRLILLNASPAVSRLLDITGMTEHLHVS